MAEKDYNYSTLTIINQQLNQQLEEVTVDRAKLLESSITLKSNLERQQVQELRSQLATEKTRSEDAWEELDDAEETCGELRSELADLKQKSATANKDLPEAADILKDLRKVLGKKSTASLADVEKILEILEGNGNE
ncbi:hypothetical protein QUA41_27585 [Microcoleus sp. Pol11C1]|uniref:hypothetical protein n=1 Tax=unclassified Microcoleus TaxID=2642155 RepID=UPI002FCE767D